jgi:hypothetical protein
MSRKRGTYSPEARKTSSPGMEASSSGGETAGARRGLAHRGRARRGSAQGSLVRGGSARGGLARRGFAGRGLALALALFAVAAGVAAPVASAQSRGIDRRAVASAERFAGDRFRFAVQTPRGARVASVNRPRAEMLRAIDAGLDELFAVARRHGYRARLSHADYTVFIARPDRVRDRDGNYSPDIAVGAAQYSGSVYDQGGYVYASGLVSSFSPAAFIIAEHDRDWGRVSNVVRYEGEHLVLYYNDPARFRATMDHSRGGAHPIIQ